MTLQHPYSGPPQSVIDAVNNAASALIDTGWHAGLVRQAAREAKRQIKRRADHVDTTAVPPRWVTESPPQRALQALLEQAGFIRENYRFCWKND